MENKSKFYLIANLLMLSLAFALIIVPVSPLTKTYYYKQSLVENPNQTLEPTCNSGCPLGDPLTQTHPTSVLLHVVSRDAEGNVVTDQWKENDLYLWNFANWTASIFGAVEYTYDIKADDGTELGVRTYLFVPTGYYDDSDVVIQVGNGTTSPTISDYQMDSAGTWFDEQAISSPSVSWVGNLANISMSATFSYVSAQNVSEAGFGLINFYHVTPSAGADSDTLLLMRDTFTPVEVGAGGDITITYIMRMNEP